MQVISKNPDWTMIAEDLNERYSTTPIEQIVNELSYHDAIIFGSPTRFGNMASPMKAMWDGTSELWTNDRKVGCSFYRRCFSSRRTVSMMFPMLHHGMIIVGVPYSVPELTESGSPYGPSRIVGRLANKEIEDADIKITRALGRRVTQIAQKFVSQ